MDDNMDLFSAIKKGIVDVRRALNNGADINKIDYSSDRCEDTALIKAVRAENYDIVELLLDRRAKKDVKNRNEETALSCAAQKGNQSIVELLLQYGADVDVTDILIHKATEGNNIEIVKIFLKAGAKFENQGFCTPLHEAAYQGNEKIFQLFLDLGADINAHDAVGTSVLSYAGRRVGNEKMVKLLLDQGASISNSRESVLHAAASHGCVETVKLILSYNKEARDLLHVDHQGDTPLLAALYTKDAQEDMVKLLLEHGANINDVRNDGTTTLQLAAKAGNEKIFQMTLNNQGVKLLTANSSRKTTLHFATQGRNEKIIRFLLDNGANVHDKNSSNKNSLHYAVLQGDEKIVRLFLELGIDVNAKIWESEETALHIACKLGFVNIIKLLLKYNSDIGAIYYEIIYPEGDQEVSSTPINMAIQAPNSRECVKVLLDYGANVNSIVEDSSENYTYESPVSIAINRVRHFPKSELALNMDYSQVKPTWVLEQLVVFGANVDETHYSHDSSNNVRIFRHCSELFMAYKKVNVQKFEETLRKIISLFSRYNYTNTSYFKEFYLQHLVKLESENLEEIIKSDDGLKNYKRVCEEELKKLKAETFENSLVSYYDFMITRDHNQLASYLRNDTIARVFTSEAYKNTFPIYQGTLYSQFRRGMWRKIMLDRVKLFFHAVADYEGNEHLPKLPWTCIQTILYELSNRDLRMLIQVCNPVDGFNIYNVE